MEFSYIHTSDNETNIKKVNKEKKQIEEKEEQEEDKEEEILINNYNVRQTQKLSTQLASLPIQTSQTSSKFSNKKSTTATINQFWRQVDQSLTFNLPAKHETKPNKKFM